MSKQPETSPQPDETGDEISMLVNRIHAAERRLRDLTGGVDAVVYPDGKSLLLQNEQEALRLSEGQFRSIFAAAATGIAISTPDGRFLRANPAYCRMLGYTERELQARDVVSVTHPDDLPLNLKLRDEVLTGQRDSFVMEKRYLKKNGDILWTRHSVSAAHAISGEIETLIVIAEDITERKHAELRLNRLSRLHTVLNQVDAAIARTRDRQALCDKICRIAIEVGKLRMAFIAELDSQSAIARPVASHADGVDDPFVAVGDIPVDGAGPASTALRTGVQQVYNDFAADPRIKDWSEVALKGGLRANASFPLRRHGSVFGVLSVYAAEIGYFQCDEIDLMAAVADNLSFALEALDEVQRRKEVDEKLQRQQTELRTLFDLMPAMIWFKDKENTILRINRRAALATGKSVEEIEGRSMFEIYPLDADKYYADDMDVIRSAAPKLGIVEMLRDPEGKVLWVQTDKVPYNDKDGNVVGIVVMSQDITERRRIETRFRRLTDSNAQSVVFWNMDGRIIESNDAFLRLIDYTREEIEAGLITWPALTPPGYRLSGRSYEELITRGITTNYEMEVVRKDGSHVPVLIGAATFEDDPNEGVSFLVDLTERKKLEQQLRQIQKMEGIGTLAGGVAHDFNNILAVILMQADRLGSDARISEDQAEGVHEIIDAVERASALTRQLLLFSSREVFQPFDMDLGESIADMIKMLKRIVGEDVEIQFNPASQPMVINADPGMMDQVVLNLVVNARDAMPGGGRLVIEMSAVEFDELAASQSAEIRIGSFVCLSVSDTGCGIPPENLQRIFEPFFTTKDVGKGTGLGLATVFGIVHQHQGWINVYSEVGHGTTFRAYFPRIAGNAAAKPARLAPKAARGGSETILLAEDESSVRASVQSALSGLGYRVLAASTGAEALEVWRKNRGAIRLLLTDLVMPDGMTGRALAEHILQDDPGLKVIYMSGYSAEVAGKDFPLTDGVDFLTKPFQAQKLANTVRNRLDQD